MPFFHDDSEEIRDLNRYEKKVITLTACGGFFAAFDFLVYFFFNDVINQAFFPASMPEPLKLFCYLLLILSGYISRPLGGIIMGDYGDRFGRKPVMLISLLLISITTFLIAILPDYHQIGVMAIVLMVIVRLCQGFGYGAEVPASWVYLAEFMPRRHLGSACCKLMSMLILAALFANILNYLLSSALTLSQMVSFGWRIPFFIGSVGTFISIFLRLKMAETPLWLTARENNKLVKRLAFRHVMTRYQYGMVMTLGLSWFTSSVYLIVFLTIPLLGAQFFDVDNSIMTIANGIGILFGALGAVVFGFCADRFNPGRVFTIACILLAIASMSFFISLENSSELVLLYYAVLGFFAGIIGIVPSVCVRLFSVSVRLSGISLTYNLIYAITGAVTPLFLIYLTNKLALAAGLYLVFICVIGVIMGFLLTNLNGLYRIEERSPIKSNA